MGTVPGYFSMFSTEAKENPVIFWDCQLFSVFSSLNTLVQTHCNKGHEVSMQKKTRLGRLLEKQRNAERLLAAECCFNILTGRGGGMRVVVRRGRGRGRRNTNPPVRRRTGRAETAPSHIGAGTAPSHVGAGTAPSHKGARAASSHVGAGAASSHVRAGTASFHVRAGTAPSAHIGTRRSAAHIRAGRPPTHVRRTGTAAAHIWARYLAAGPAK